MANLQTNAADLVHFLPDLTLPGMFHYSCSIPSRQGQPPAYHAWGPPPGAGARVRRPAAGLHGGVRHLPPAALHAAHLHPAVHPRPEVCPGPTNASHMPFICLLRCLPTFRQRQNGANMFCLFPLQYCVTFFRGSMLPLSPAYAFMQPPPLSAASASSIPPSSSLVICCVNQGAKQGCSNGSGQLPWGRGGHVCLHVCCL